MSGSRTNKLDVLLKAYSIVSEREDAWLSKAILRNAEADDVRFDPEKMQPFMERFSDEKPFGDQILQAISQKNMTKRDVSSELGISEEIIEKVLTNTALPNIVPLRKMIALLRYLKIPLDRAVEGMRVSLDRFGAGDSYDWTPSPAMRRGQHVPSKFGRRSGESSKETLKRGLEAYIKRLTEEGV
ncbi:MAG: helix-turn-helix transcriptional regulator [Candidatus Tectomicrobia bacterium]|nr:helix-turn-helix transcriptional regulator [Candidatus Tectomicrobia bacterium]